MVQKRSQGWGEPQHTPSGRPIRINLRKVHHHP